MTPNFICHPDFENLKPLNVFRKEYPQIDPLPHPENLKNRHILYRKKFTLENVTNATLRITADDYYKLYINGVFVAMGPAASYPGAYNYNEIDVTKYLKQGENCIAVHTYYQGLINRVWVSGDLREMLWCDLTVDGESILVTDTSWKCHDHTGYTSVGIIGYDTAFAERYDSTAPEAGFAEENFDDSGWQYAKISLYQDHKLICQKTPLIDVYKITPKIIEKKDYGYFVDIGTEIVGYLYACANGRHSDKLSLYYGEELTDEGRVRYNMRCNCVYHEEWILSGKNDILNNYDYKAFRYVEIHAPEHVKIDNISIIVRHYPFTQQTEYTTDRETLKSIFKLCSDTIKYGTQENYVDCPTREKGQYLGDVSIAARAHAILTGDASLMKKAIIDFCNSAFICPGIMAVSCSSLMQEIADYSLQLAASALWIYHFDNDLDFLKYTEPYLTEIYEYFKKFTNEEGLIHNQREKWNLVDWPMNLRDNYNFPLERPIGEGLHNVINAFWYGFLASMDEIYTILGIQKRTMRDQVKSAYINRFYSEKSGLFCDSIELTHSSIHSNVLPLLFGICDGDDNLISNIVNLIAERRLTAAGTYMSYFTLAALVKHGKRDLAEELTCDKGCWLNMIKEGATTTFEAWGKEQKWNTSLFHPWSVAPLIVFNDKYRIY